MRKSLAATAVTAGVTAAGTAIARTVTARRGGITGSGRSSTFRSHRDTDLDRWRAVTVLRRDDEVRATGLTPLTDLGPALETEVRPAPDGKGTVIAARWRSSRLGALEPADAAHAVLELRAALRRVKQELEIGWQVTPTRSPVEATPLNLPVREIEHHAFGGSVR